MLKYCSIGVFLLIFMPFSAAAVDLYHEGILSAVCNSPEAYRAQKERRDMAISPFPPSSPTPKVVGYSALEAVLVKVADSTFKSKQEIRSALKRLMEKWRDGATRKNIANREAYLNDLRSLIEMTATGREILACYEKTPSAPGSKISGSLIMEIPPQGDGTGAAMSFGFEQDPQNPGKLLKTIYFNFDSEPMRSAHVFLHEMAHGCTAEEVREMNELTSLNQPGSPARREVEQRRVLNELNAYQKELQFLYELALAAPEELCLMLFKPDLAGPTFDPIFVASLDGTFAKGRAPYHIAVRYSTVRGGKYDPGSFFVLDGNGKPIEKKQFFLLRPDFIDRLVKAGFKVHIP
ncbi:MAG: hypothetical protein A2428_04200 [Bdellovibrionales bacterium RIFOXYC1_FULL_54_43]|nr:MAG: hypothetical protein A2428_04200 [Bdellovibrionales bacterium RIFOXYC1_FULL_54_43]OFZ82818.1 MAG: hypothetical protein A2603_07720 [Bdellovibrionales bacterium RIFOXYD1_FULL_55_31]